MMRCKFWTRQLNTLFPEPSAIEEKRLSLLYVPEELIQEVVSYLDTKHLLSLMTTCRYLHKLKYDRKVMTDRRLTCRKDITLDELHWCLNRWRGALFNVDMNRRFDITDQTFRYLKGTIHTLVMTGCKQRWITSRSFKYLQGTIHSLDMSGCNQSTISDSAFQYLQGTIHTLKMIGCNQRTITNHAFSYLHGTIRHLDMSFCRQHTISDHVFRYLAPTILTLNISKCYQFSDQAFYYLQNSELHSLIMQGCNQSALSIHALVSLAQDATKLQVLDISMCPQLRPETKNLVPSHLPIGVTHLIM